jgi:hypothetical protein
MESERHVPIDDLAVWALGGLSEQRRQEIAAHLARDCEPCLNDLGWLRKTLRIARSDRQQAPPPSVLQPALRIFQDQRQAATGDELPRIVGRLLFDSLNAPQPVGMRGAAQHGRQVQYAIEPLDLFVDLRVEREEPLVHLVGQILHTDPPAQPAFPERVAIESRDGESDISILATGEFTATLTGEGPHTLVMRIAHQEISIPIPEWVDDDPAAR